MHILAGSRSLKVILNFSFFLTILSFINQEKKHTYFFNYKTQIIFWWYFWILKLLSRIQYSIKIYTFTESTPRLIQLQFLRVVCLCHPAPWGARPLWGLTYPQFKIFVQKWCFKWYPKVSSKSDVQKGCLKVMSKSDFKKFSLSKNDVQKWHPKVT